MVARLLFTLLACFLLGAPSLSAQKAKFKNLKATCQKTRLPQNYVDPDKRTYSLYVKGKYTGDVEAYNRPLYGWAPVDGNPNLEAVISLYGFRVNPAKRKSEKKQTKDKEGNVTKSWTEYTYSGSAEGKGTLYIYGESEAFKYNKKDDEKTKAELARDAKAAEEKKALAANPFLSADDAADAADDEKEDSDIGENTGLENAMLPLAATVDVDVSKSVQTRANRSSSKAYADYRDNQRPKLYDLKNTYPKQSYRKAMNTLNARYGYSPVNYTVWLKEMKSDKHPDYQMWNDACTATKTLFKPFKYNKSIEDARPKFAPVVAYFTDKVAAISDKDRKGKKMKQAAFNNAINTLYYLDQYEEVLALCDQYADSKFLDKAAKKMKKKTNRQQALMAFHKVSSCHMDSLEDTDDTDIESETEEAEPETDAEGQK